MLHDRSLSRGQIRPGTALLPERPFIGASLATGGGPWRVNCVIFGWFLSFPGRGGRLTGLRVEVQGAGGACSRTFHDVAVNHGGSHAGVAHQVLDRADVGFDRQHLEALEKSEAGRGGRLTVRQGG